ncbi:Metalloenzyme, LuxS/M16 peptidase-like protein [Cantharellus anzutake]|uniref:Metalloenzyme, LuxS/M16 peptidase-like protein n=1 Tax=Cantharellus anzutake TaxID=1750568 RepID=UPI00190381EE|nr:Metalloenzyme, LuxS/M16 peptidase-like protein [Cantharellus anzutake]KAF8337466.1 Metalloenzyme, LuxS/M16 peptidase-like protein [Cantharellus anzutake]
MLRFVPSFQRQLRNRLVANSQRALFISCTRPAPLRRPLRSPVPSRRGILTSATTMPRSQNEMKTSLGSFDLLQRIKVDNSEVVISRWQSRESGLTVVHVDYDAPIVKGYFVVPTEIFNDSGCPHTLEHLVFLGSEKYPYKGVLDNLANRAFAAGTNAWTDTDHTAYTIETAGEQGFLQLLPVFVDHILYPTLADSGFVTEVHHINHKGEDAGVVYSEMQGRENTPGDLAALRQQRLFYPSGSAYRSETGGLMEALRKLTIDEIRNYHASYYVPHNLCLIVSGKLSTEALLGTVHREVEPRIKAHNQANGPRPAGWKRPFMETPSIQVAKMPETLKDVVEFPESDESIGELQLSFVGPTVHEHGDHRYLMDKAIDVLGVYLTESAVAPLTKQFVEIESPLCTYISFYESAKASFTTLDVHFGAVPTEELDLLAGKFKSALECIVRDGFDMNRIRLVLKKERLRVSSSLESSGGDYFTNSIINDFLYGDANGQDLGPLVAEFGRLKHLSEWTNQDWVNVLEKFYIKNNPVVIQSKPSAKLQEILEATEKARVQKQREKLGPVGLEKLKKILEDAKTEHDRPIPSEVLTSFPVPDVSTISWIPVDSARNESGKVTSRGRPPNAASTSVEDYLTKDPASVPYFIQFDHVKSHFITVSAYLSTAKVPPQLKPYISAYLSSFFMLPIIRSDGTRVSHEEVVRQLEDDTVSYGISLGYEGYFQELVRCSIKLETSQYSTGIAWLRDLLFCSEYDVERLTVIAAKLQQNLPEMKRDGNTVVGSVYGQLLFDETSTLQASALLAQLDFSPKLSQLLKTDPKRVVQDLQELRSYLTDPSALRFSVAGNVLALEKPRSAWMQYFKELPNVVLEPVPWASQNLSDIGKKPVRQGIVVSLATIESSFALHTTKSISGFGHPEHPALRLACEVLDGAESYLWKFIRGSGLAYGANLSLDSEAGLLSLQLYRCPNSFQAFEEAAKVVKGLADGSVAIEDTTIDAAKSSIAYDIAQSLSTPKKATTSSFVNQVLRDVPQDFGQLFLQQIRGVTKEEVQESIRKYILPLFDASSSVAVVVSAPSKAGEIKDSLTALGYEVEARTLDVRQEDLDAMEVDESGSEIDSDSENGSDSNDGMEPHR